MRERKKFSAEQFAGDRLLGTFVTPLRPLVATDQREVEAALQNAAKGGLARVEKAGAIQVTPSDDEKRSWYVELGAQARVSDGRHARPALEVIGPKELLLQILAGDISPLEAFATGNLRVRGDVGLAALAVRALQR